MGQSGGRSKAVAPALTSHYATLMTHERRFEELLTELERIGVDPDNFPAGLEISRDAALRVLARLPDGAGPEAFLAGLRAAMSGDDAVAPPVSP